MYKRITRCAPSYPPLLSPEARDLLAQLLVRDPNARLGMVSCSRQQLAALLSRDCRFLLVFACLALLCCLPGPNAV